MSEDSIAHVQWKNPESAPGVVLPQQKRMRLHDAKVFLVDIDQRTLVVTRSGLGSGDMVTIRLPPFARVSRHWARSDLKDVKPGDRVSIDFFLDDYVDMNQATETNLKAPTYGTSRRLVEFRKQRIEMTLLGHYGKMRRRWYVDEIEHSQPIQARGINVLNENGRKTPYWEPPVMWLSGRATAIDSDTRAISVERTPLTAEKAIGFRFYQELRDAGKQVALTEAVRLRTAEVQSWLSSRSRTVLVLADIAVDYCLNGKFGGRFEDIAVGDFLGVRYYPDRQSKELLVPHTIRISKPLQR